MKEPPSDFNWRVYADATCAGLSVLIPIPLLDLFFESVFLGKMPRSVFAARKKSVSDQQLAILRRNDSPLFSSKSCVTVPLATVFYVLKRLSRKILYFLTIREATEKLSEHWHRAYLLDHVATLGRLQQDPSAEQVKTALEASLKAADTSPLMQLARSTVRRAGRVLQFLNRTRKQGPSEAVHDRERQLEGAWAEVAGHFAAVALDFDRRFEEAGPTATTEGIADELVVRS